MVGFPFSELKKKKTTFRLTPFSFLYSETSYKYSVCHIWNVGRHFKMKHMYILLIDQKN